MAKTPTKQPPSRRPHAKRPRASAPATEIRDPARRPAARLHQQADDAATQLTTNQGVPISDNQNSLKAGARGPVLLQDFILREKIMHFDHERIPERVVHARGSAAHGFFECLDDCSDITARRLPADGRASARRCSRASRRSPATRARSTCRATCAASR